MWEDDRSLPVKIVFWFLGVQNQPYLGWDGRLTPAAVYRGWECCKRPGRTFQVWEPLGGPSGALRFRINFVTIERIVVVLQVTIWLRFPFQCPGPCEGYFVA